MTYSWLNSVGFSALLAVSSGASASSIGTLSPHEEYARRVHASQVVAPLTSDLFGEQISLYNGATEFSVVDIDLPGNGPPMQLRRRLKIESKKDIQPLGGFGAWEIDIPHMTGIFGPDGWNVGHNGGTKRCSQIWWPNISDYFKQLEVWTGNKLHLPGAGDEAVFLLETTPAALKPDDGKTYLWGTRSDHRFTCTPTTTNGYFGEGFVAVDRDGTRYTFDFGTDRPAGTVAKPTSFVGQVITQRLPRTQVYLLVSRVEDRHGNWVRYDYGHGDRLTSMTASDGRVITMHYDATGSLLQRAVANGRTWTYRYGTGTLGWGPTHLLESVTLPDGSQWRYGYRNSTATNLLWPIYSDDGTSPYDFRCLEPLPASDDFVLEATHPSGAVGTFSFDYVRHKRHVANRQCVRRWQSPYSSDLWYHELVTPDFFDNYALQGKTIAGPGLSPQTWGYRYRMSGIGDPPGTKVVRVWHPDGSSRLLTFGVEYENNDGQLLAESTVAADGKVLRTIKHEYLSWRDSYVRFPHLVGGGAGGDDRSNAYFRPALRTEVEQDGVTFSRTPDGFDAMGRPTSVTEGNTLGFSRTIATEYHDDTRLWVLGQPARTTLVAPGPAQELATTEYDLRALPVRQYRFGALQQQASYHADGQLATIADGRGNVTAMSEWKRGIPQSIDFPDASRVSATVDDNGWLTSVTGQNGATTRYSHDPMGRLIRIRYPDNDSVAWADTTLSFLQATAPAHGLPSGHWRQDVRTGNAVRSRYFDGLWRPVLEAESDATRTDSTLRQVVRRYDADNRVVFESHALRGVENIAAVTQGTRSTYDALGRITSSHQDSELGVLATTLEYLSGLRTRATNPHGQVTTTSHAAGGSPEEAWPILVAEPEDTHTQITRDIFGKPTAIRRHNGDGTVSLTRQFVYDAEQRVCKTIEPETGATVRTYDAAGNLEWSASGLSLPDPVACNRNEAFDSERRVVRVYDAMNRPTILDFPDGNGSQQWAYRPDGLVAAITTNNDGVATTNRYDYNLRGLLTRETQEQAGDSTWSLAYAYDPHASLAALTYPSGRSVAFAPDALGQPTQVGAFATDAQFHPNGSLAGFRSGDGTVRTIAQNERGLPERIRDTNDGRLLFDDSLDFDGNGNLAAISDGLSSARGNRTMRYDGRDRLVEAVSPLFGGTASYAYDVLDNLTSLRLPDRRQDFRHDGANRLTNVVDATTGASTVGLGYDLQGNLANRNGRLHVFDYGNRLRRVAGLERYRYDGHGRRVTATTDDAAGAEIRSMYGLDGVLRHQRDARAGKSLDYIQLGNTLVAHGASVIAPLAPILEAPGYSTHGDYTLTWTAVGGAMRYELEEKPEGGPWKQLLIGPEHTLDLKGQLGGGWGYRVRACNAAGCGEWSREAAVFVQTPPNPPSEISVPALGPNGNYTVAWLPPLTRDNGPTSYRLEERAGQGAWLLAYEGTALEHAFTGRLIGTYTYRVTSCNPFGCSALVEASNAVTVIFPPAAPVLTVPGSQLTHAYTVSWSNVGADRYEADEQLNGGTWARIHAAAGLSVAVTGRVTGTYGYRVRACNAAGCSAYTPVRSVEVTVPPPTAPTLTTPGTSNTGTFAVTWTAIAHATRYELQERLGAAAFALVHNAASVSATRTALNGGAWEYRVRACNAAGCGPWSASKLTNVVPIHRAELVSFKVNGYASQAGLNTWTMVYGERQAVAIEVRNTGTHAWNDAGSYRPVLARNSDAFPMPAQVTASQAVTSPGQVATFHYTFDPPYGPVSPMPIKDFGGAIWLQGVQHLFDVPVRRFYIENAGGHCSGSACEDPR